jgi:hypothetical protein
MSVEYNKKAYPGLNPFCDEILVITTRPPSPNKYDKISYCVGEQFNYIYLRTKCFTVAPVRHKIFVLNVEKSASCLDLKCANTLREQKITRILDFVV